MSTGVGEGTADWIDERLERCASTAGRSGIQRVVQAASCRPNAPDLSCPLMIPLFIGMTVVNLLMLGATTALGYVVERDPARWSPHHQLAGVLAAMTCVAVHCVVF